MCICVCVYFIAFITMFASHVAYNWIIFLHDEDISKILQTSYKIKYLQTFLDT